MNYSVSVRQSPEICKEADELMIDYRDVNILYDLIKKYPKKKFVIKISKDEDIDYSEIKMFCEKANVVLALEDLSNTLLYKNDKLKFYWAYPVTSYYELKGILSLGVSEVLLGAPLYFDLTLSALENVEVRLVANLCFDPYIPRKDGIRGTYIRPEDVQEYEPYVNTLEFITDSLDKEATLFSIYKRRNWPGNLNLLLTNLNYDVDNRAIPEEFAKARIQCRQSCMRTGGCNFCETAVKFSNTLKRNKNNVH